MHALRHRADQLWGLRYYYLVLLVAMAYAHLRLASNVENPYASWDALAAMEAPLPFGHRVLVPLLCQPLLAAGILVDDAFFLFEWLATALLLVELSRLLQLYLPKGAAQAFALGFVLFLPCAFLLKVQWPALFYPYDTPAMWLTVLGLRLSLQGRLWALALCTALAAVNRESAILLPALHVALHLKRTHIMRPIGEAAAMVVLFIAVRLCISAVLDDNQPFYENTYGWMRGDEFRIHGNMKWLADFMNLLELLCFLGFLPVMALVLRKKGPPILLRVVPVAGFYFVGLMFMANPYEPRVFGEVIALVYPFVAVGMSSLDRSSGDGGIQPPLPRT